MKRMTLALVLAAIVMILCGCLPSAEQNYLAFREGDIRATVSGRLELTKDDGYTPLGACAGIGSDGATLEFKAQIESVGGVCKVKFISPASLEGFELQYTQGGVNFVLNGDKNISSGELTLNIPNICEAFYTGRQIISVSPLPDGKTEVYLSSGGKSPIAVYIFDKDSTLPSQISATTEKFKLYLFDISGAQVG